MSDRLNVTENLFKDYTHPTMTRSARFKKQYKGIGFGDSYDSRTVEGHQNGVIEARETREYNRRMREIQLEREANKPVIAKLAD
jgi:hypothetical protein